MTETQKELAVKPQSDWDGYIIPRELQHPQFFNVWRFLQKNGYSESTVKAAGKRLKHLQSLLLLGSAITFPHAYAS